MSVEGYPVSPGVMLNIDLARKIVRRRRPNTRLYVPLAAKLIRRGEAKINWKHLRWGKLKDEPVILMKVAGVRVLIDGWHRAAQADKRGRTYLPAHLLNARDVNRLGASSHFFRVLRPK